MIRKDDVAHNADAVQHVMFGQTMVEGMSGNAITDLTQPSNHTPPPPRARGA